MTTNIQPALYLKIGKNSQEYLISILTTLVFPLLSLVIEYFVAEPNSIGIKSLLLGSSIYAASIAFLTQRKLIFILSFIFSFILAILYGISLVENTNNFKSLGTIPSNEIDVQDHINQDSLNRSEYKGNEKYTYKLNDSYLPKYANSAALLAIVFLFLQQLLERYNRHIILKEDFTIFT